MFRIGIINRAQGQGKAEVQVIAVAKEGANVLFPSLRTTFVNQRLILRMFRVLARRISMTRGRR